jgi:Uma2 family endonuclease
MNYGKIAGKEAKMSETIRQTDRAISIESRAPHKGKGVPDGEFDITHIITEDDEPVDNFPSEKNQRLLTESLYSSKQGALQQRKFIVAANVGLFYAPDEPPIVPDVFLSMDVELAENWWDRRHRSYFFWEFGKPPEVVIEIVSNREGDEAEGKLARYARIGVDYYVIFDPMHLLSQESLRAYRRYGGQFLPIQRPWFEELELGLRLWEGGFEEKYGVWLRWCDRNGRILATGAERAEDAEFHALFAEERAEQALERSVEAQQQAAEAQQQAAEAQQQAAEAQQQAAEAQQRADKEAAARLALEDELARLKAELARLQSASSTHS